MRDRDADTDTKRDAGAGKQSGREETGGSTAWRRGVGALHAAVGNQAVRDLHEAGELQAKLDVTRPGDPTEREAERVAERVLETDEGRAEPEVDPVQDVRRTASTTGGAVSGERERQVRAALRGGRRLPDRTRSYFESRFGRDFSDVRIHTDARAHEAARAIDAEAFTLGTDVAFARGNYRPDTRSGKQLLAHELTHVVQGGNAVGRAPRDMMGAGGAGGGVGGEEETFRVSFPNVQEMSNWEKAQFLGDLASMSGGGVTGASMIAGTLLNLYTVSQVLGYTAAVGIGGAGSIGAGGGGSSGIVFFPSGQIGAYGTAAGEVGAVVGAGVEVEYTVVFGGRNKFTGEAMGLNAGISLAASGHGTLLLDPDTQEVIGLSIDAGVGIGATILEFSTSYEGTNVYTGE
ncbi:MAG: DUF4157 domain-containing protein [Haloarculaceae archaeon]